MSLGEIAPSTTDLGTLLLAHFGLVSGAPDWFLVPWGLGSGTTTIRGLAVTNVFGERTWVEPAGAGPDDDWQRWAMFAVNIRSQAPEPSDPSLLLLPTVAKTQEDPPVEDVVLLRDEVTNMVWGVEKRISFPTGKTKPGGEAAEETYRFHRSLVERSLAEGSLESAEVEYRAPIRYNVMSGFPEHWIPFIGVHVAGSNREIQLQRASLPRIIEGDPELPVKVEPRSVLLRQGLDGSSPEPYYVHEEEVVTRAGVRLFRSFQRARWYGGRVVTWLGAQKQTGRGSGTSGFRFDTVEPTGQEEMSDQA